jgi:GH25 family lysozyme M1 (1,4-beta-N-acetylmuramidase)
MIWEAYMFDLKQLSEYQIWYADYEQTPQTPYAFTFWQYSESGQVPGIEGNCDLDIRFVKK